LTKTPLISSVVCFNLGSWNFVWGGLSPQSARGDGTERTVDKSWRSCRSYYFSYKLLWKSAASEDIKVTL